MEQGTIFLKALSLKIHVILSCNLSTNITVLENQHPEKENYHLREFPLSKSSFKASLRQAQFTSIRNVRLVAGDKHSNSSSS